MLSERKAGLPTLAVYDLTPAGHAGQLRAKSAFPEPTYTAGAHINREFATSVFRYSYTSLVAPPSVYEYDVPQRAQSTLLKQQEVPGGFDVSHATPPSGSGWKPRTKPWCPVSLVYRRDTLSSFSEDKAGTNPLYVYGYGSYGYALPVGFSPTRLSLLDRGLVLAYAHIRGGGELGDPWHDAGKMRSKA